MDFQELKKKALRLHPEIILEEIISHPARRKIKTALLAVFLLLSAVLILTGESLGAPEQRLWGFSLVIFSFWLVFFTLDAFYYSHYFSGTFRGGRETRDFSDSSYISLSYELASVLARTSRRDLTLSFLSTDLGGSILLRLGIYGHFRSFRKSRENPLSGKDFKIDFQEINLIEYLRSLYRQDKEFSDFLFSFGVQEKEFVGAARWLLRVVKSSRVKERWWGKNALMRKGSIGSDWSYGRAYELEKYGYRVEGNSQLGIYEGKFYHEDELSSLINILSKEREANALLVGEEGVGKMDMVTELSGRISAGEIEGKLGDKHIMALYSDSLIASSKEKVAFESRLIKILNQAVGAGNIILVIPNFPSFVSSALRLGSDVISLLDPFLNSQSLQVIALSDTEGFHKELERNPQVIKRFERVFVKSGNKEGVMRLIENEALNLENRHNIVFTYQALLAIEEGAERYFSEGSILDKSLDLLSEIVPLAEKRDKNPVITKEDINSLIESKTGISLGGVSTDAEKDKLLNLEKVLHERVVGQDEAVKAISGAVRRGRAGISSSKKPLGSFLFLGPTGVGKTETAKALAEVFFGDESKMLRLDMSEYNSLDSLDRLIGSFEGGKSGILSSMIRENPYGVLLLDEFEKTHRNVLDLFLQIFDEGVFSDMEGKHVNARNIIFVATSNAGSSLIWDILQSGKSLTDEKDTVIESIIRDGVFKPELLNRFDGVILFHPLESNHLQEVARRKLLGLKERIREKGIDLVITDSLVEYVAEKGTDPKFGARPLNRVIKEEIEELIAEKIIEGALRPGTEISLSREDIEGKTE